MEGTCGIQHHATDVFPPSTQVNLPCQKICFFFPLQVKKKKITADTETEDARKGTLSEGQSKHYFKWKYSSNPFAILVYLRSLLPYYHTLISYTSRPVSRFVCWLVGSLVGQTVMGPVSLHTDFFLSGPVSSCGLHKENLSTVNELRKHRQRIHCVYISESNML